MPFGLLTLAVVTVVLKLPRPPARGRVDVLGVLLLAAASTCLVLLTSWGGTEYRLGLYGSSWARRGRARRDRPLPRRRAFRHRTPHPAEGCSRTASSTSPPWWGSSSGSPSSELASDPPTFLQMVDGASATESHSTCPMMGGIVGASVVCGQLISRTGRYKIYPVLGSALSVLGMWLLSRLEVDTPRLQYSVWMAVLGAGIGMVMPVLVLAVQNSVRPADLGTATSA